MTVSLSEVCKTITANCEKQRGLLLRHFLPRGCGRWVSQGAAGLEGAAPAAEAACHMYGFIFKWEFSGEV